MTKRTLAFVALLSAALIAASHPRVRAAVRRRFGTRRQNMDKISRNVKMQLSRLVQALPDGQDWTRCPRRSR